MKTSEVRLMYWMYYAAGGVYTSEEFSTCAKLCWFALYFGIAGIAGACGIGYCITVTSFNPLDSIIVLSLSVAAIGFPTVVSLVTWYYRYDLEKLLHFIEHASNAEHRRTKQFFNSRLIFWIALIFILGLILLTIPALDLLLIPEKENFVRKEKYHLVGMPFMDRVSTQSAYWAMYSVELVLAGFTLFASFAEPLLIFAIAFHLNDIALGYCERLKALDKVDDASFDLELVSYIQEYRVLMSSIQLARSYVLIFGALVVPSLNLILANQTFIFLSPTSSFFLKMRLSLVAILSIVYLYPHCRLGTMVNELKEEIVLSVYGLPWYNRSPRGRKTFYIFLNQVQRSLIFNAFGVIPIEVALLPKILRLTYSLANVLAVSLSHESR